mmetsp:Transcript_20206/g.43916  ORF Transcript_20206/g.43916 Transcript_20206/m.43916 type:complete len:208 (+) Transcript_20206:184-807(+)|eukprot:CAMPEP_0172317282 /NCGR_PEP_ID=MMETSP1058-20130122/31169_1 /TAXON_ID=83371 /ORGANISM="Detonula confervacea, Strain CCMP 353" /LENGTH=207 /DNA_ID=CAMNT_0013031807 /DNA_START=132 /DNA_END=755 /DNA_ORIENTATION=-
MSDEPQQQQQRRRPYKSSKYGDDDQQKSQTKRRRQAAISLASFSSKKGHDRALQEFKKRKETKFNKNATLLRGYQKAMKQGGYDAGRGASRKRVDRDEDVDASETNDKSNDKEDGLETTNKKPFAKRHKSDPLHQARKEAERRKAEELEAVSQKEQRQQNEGQKTQNRKVRARKMMKRTKRGQPLMKNVIGDLLGKIKSDVGDGAES